jgi:MinD-like ATPase involved in chromosome partitioning or flagellar assembly
MALVNVAAEIAKQGKRVLIVDFDLEAPGLDTFDITRSDQCNRGLLDFVCDYQNTAEVPDVREYVYQSQANLGEGQLLIMPAGLQDQDYHTRFCSVDWADLYSRQRGFLLFEDLKEQWKELLKVDYVLIDSRTGHTDIGGICTRQLPNSVVIFFFPNEQNRLGLMSVVSQIRAELKGPLKKTVDLHFVISNVPDLDDEEEILENEIERFEQSLGFASPSAVIHHYDSLALIEQATFIVKRPRSRLSKEYAGLSAAIIRKNLDDRIGALSFLDFARRKRTGVDLEEQLQRIRTSHAKDAEVLVKLASVRVKQRKNEEAIAILTQTFDSETKEPEVLLLRAQLCMGLGQKEKAVGDLKDILSSPNASGVELSIVVRMLREIQPDLTSLISRSPALDRIEIDYELIQEFETSPEMQWVAVRLLSRWLANHKEDSAYRKFKNELLICLIGRGGYKEALGLFGEARVSPEQLELPEIFNYAMALWGMEGIVPDVYLRQIVHQPDVIPESPNKLQCMAIANYLVGNYDLASTLIDKARDLAMARGASSFSCWSYLMVSVERFISDLEEMVAAFRDNKVIPEFIRRNSLEVAIN